MVSHDRAEQRGFDAEPPRHRQMGLEFFPEIDGIIVHFREGAERQNIPIAGIDQKHDLMIYAEIPKRLPVIHMAQKVAEILVFIAQKVTFSPEQVINRIVGRKIFQRMQNTVFQQKIDIIPNFLHCDKFPFSRFEQKMPMYAHKQNAERAVYGHRLTFSMNAVNRRPLDLISKRQQKTLFRVFRVCTVFVFVRFFFIVKPYNNKPIHDFSLFFSRFTLCFV